jgi:hypothetical protein
MLGSCFASSVTVAGCATSNGFAGYAGAKADSELTFNPDYSRGADQLASADLKYRILVIESGNATIGLKQ